MNKIEEILSNRSTEDVLAGFIVGHMSASCTYPGGDFIKRKLLYIHWKMISQLLSTLKLVLHQVPRKGHANFWSSLVSTAIQDVQLHHFKLFLEKEPMRPEDMAEVYRGLISLEVCQGDVKRVQRLHWCRLSDISMSQGLIVKRHLRRNVACDSQGTLDECKIYRRSQKADFTRRSGEEVPCHAVETFFRLPTSVMNGDRVWN